MFKVYLDDERPTPNGWLRAWTFEQCIAMLKTGKVEALSLDHDLGKCTDCGGDIIPGQEEFFQMGAPPKKGIPAAEEKPHCPHIKNGYDVVCEIERMVADGFIPPDFIAIHSDNCAGRSKIEQGIESIYKIREEYKKGLLLQSPQERK